jgi:hypothetical protein
MGAPSKKATRKVRTKKEFDAAGVARAMAPPVSPPSAFAWSLEQIRGARDAQLRGQFDLAAKMARSMRTDDALFVAREGRLAPQIAIGVELVPAKGAEGKRIANEAEGQFGQDGVAISSATRSDIHGCLVDHGVAFATLEKITREDGSRHDAKVSYWPIEHVRWDANFTNPATGKRGCFMTRVDSTSLPGSGSNYLSEIPIVHAQPQADFPDVTWIVIAAHDHEPFAQGAALLSAPLIWARHAHAVRDWAKGSGQHGNAKIVGEMPEGIPVTSPEGAAFLELVRVCANPDTAYGIKPKGYELDFITNGSTAWQVWAELILNAEKAAARVYLGTDGILGSQGGAPGVDIGQLFGVATTKIQGDLNTISRCLTTGAIEVWCAWNFNDSSLTPTHRYMIPDADADAVRDAYAKRLTAFHDALDRAERRFVVDQEYVDALAKEFGVTPPKMKPPAAAPAAPAAASPAPALRVVP